MRHTIRYVSRLAVDDRPILVPLFVRGALMKTKTEKRLPIYRGDSSACMYRELPGHRFKCSRNILDNERGGKYNCKKHGKCYWYQTEEQHQMEVAAKTAEWERKTYERLKAKFEQ